MTATAVLVEEPGKEAINIIALIVNESMQVVYGEPNDYEAKNASENNSGDHTWISHTLEQPTHIRLDQSQVGKN